MRTTRKLNSAKLEIVSILFLISGCTLLAQQNKQIEGTDSNESIVNDNLFEADTGTFIDERDMHAYRWVRIGYQIWMAENLAYLPFVVPSTMASNYEAPLNYVYGNEGTSIGVARISDNFAIYGVLYNWMSAVTGTDGSDENPSNLQGICPCGWHLPSVNEWDALIDHLGGNKTAGTKLKKEGQSFWKKQDAETTNESGFSAMPAGYLGNGFFTDLGYTGFWWSSTSYTPIRAWGISMSSRGGRVTRSNNYKEYGLSVRCVKDP